MAISKPILLLLKIIVCYFEFWHSRFVISALTPVTKACFHSFQTFTKFP